MNLKVMTRVREHAAYAEMCEPNHVRFFTALQGSQNYGTEDRESDVDTKSLFIPTFESLVFNRKRLAKTLEVPPTVEHAEVKDVREIFACFLKQNINFVEILFTEYVDVNLAFTDLYAQLHLKREDIAHYNPYLSLRTMCGMMYEKYHAFEHPYPSAMEKLTKFGYDPKQLSHMLRVQDFLVRYLEGESYAKCLRPIDAEYLRDVKRGLYPYTEARALADSTKAWIDTFLAKMKEQVPNESNVEVEAFLDTLTYQLCERCYKKYNMY